MKQICYSIIILSVACLLLFFGCSKSGRRSVVNKQESIENKTLVNIPESTPILEPDQSSASSPATGTNLIEPKGLSGGWTLKITNGTSFDAVVRLADGNSKKTRRLVYVRAESEFTIEGIGICKCLLQFSLGTDWDKSKRKFLRDKSYSQFNDLLEFKETSLKGFEVTLNPVIDGNARTTPIDESDFEDNVE